jgi:exonuclease III
MARVDDIYRLSLLSFNVRGLRMETKRISIFQYIIRKNIDICFLQETHSKESDENIWKNEWGGEVFFSHGTSQARGVMVLVRPGFDMKVDEVRQDNDGRLIYLNMVS